MNSKQGVDLESKILQANQQLLDLQRTLKDKKENIKNLKDKNHFLQETTSLLQSKLSPENQGGKTKGSFGNLKKKEAKNQLKFLKKEIETLDLTIISEQKRIEQIQQIEKYNRIKALYHDLRHIYKR